MESNNIGNEYISYTGNICSFIRDYDNDKIRTLSIDELMNNITPLKKQHILQRMQFNWPVASTTYLRTKSILFA